MLEEGLDPFSENPYGFVGPKVGIDNMLDNIDKPVTIIKQDDNPKYGILIPPSQGTSSVGVIFINEEHLNYFNNKFIKYSARDFIIKSLIHYSSHSVDSTSLVNVDDYENDKEIIQAIIDTLALNRFKFVFSRYILDDIDIRNLNPTVVLLFDKNESKKIFNIYQSKDDDRHIKLNVEGINKYVAQVITGPDGNEYKQLIISNQ